MYVCMHVQSSRAEGKVGPEFPSSLSEIRANERNFLTTFARGRRAPTRVDESTRESPRALESRREQTTAKGES